jgi:hypothetical protein
MTEKRKFNPLFPTYFKMAKNVKSLIIFARDWIRSKNYWDNRINAPSPPIQCCVNDGKEKIQPTFSNIDHGGRGKADVYFKMWKVSVFLHAIVDKDNNPNFFPTPLAANNLGKIILISGWDELSCSKVRQDLDKYHYYTTPPPPPPPPNVNKFATSLPAINNDLQNRPVARGYWGYWGGGVNHQTFLELTYNITTIKNINITTTLTWHDNINITTIIV